MELDAPRIFLHEDGQHEEVDPTKIVLKDNPPQEGEEEEEEEKKVKEEKEDTKGYQTSEEADE